MISMGTIAEDVVDNLGLCYIANSSIHGYGLFADRDIDKGVVLGSLDGQLIPWRLHRKYNLTLEWNAIDKDTLLVRAYRTKYSYINHQSVPNLVLLYDPLRVVALKRISKGEEMTLDYRKEPLPPEYIESKGKFYL